MSNVPIKGGTPVIPFQGQGGTGTISLVGVPSQVTTASALLSKVTINLQTILGTPAANYLCKIKLSDSSPSGRNFLIMKTPQSVRTDAQGFAEISLWMNVGLLKNTHYRISIYEPDNWIPVLEDARFELTERDRYLEDIIEL